MSDYPTVFREEAPGAFSFGKAVPSKIFESLPPAVYTIEFTREGQLNLVKDRDNFGRANLSYSKHASFVKDILESYDGRPHVSAAYLRGHRGTGKTSVCSAICNVAIERKLPIIMILRPVPVQLLYTVLKAVGACVVFIDEFDKKYREGFEPGNSSIEPLNGFVELLTDRSLHRVLFLMADNGNISTPETFKYRPERVQHLIEFPYCDASDFKEVCGDDYLAVPAPVRFYIERFCIPMNQVGYDAFESISTVAKKSETITDLLTQLVSNNTINLPRILVTVCWVKDYALKRDYDVTIVDNENLARLDEHSVIELSLTGRNKDGEEYPEERIQVPLWELVMANKNGGVLKRSYELRKDLVLYFTSSAMGGAIAIGGVSWKNLNFLMVVEEFVRPGVMTSPNKPWEQAYAEPSVPVPNDNNWVATPVSILSQKHNEPPGRGSVSPAFFSGSGTIGQRYQAGDRGSDSL